MEPQKFLQRRWFDFRLGHSLYLAFFFSFANFILIFHRLFIERIGFELSLFWFVVIFLLTYFPTSIIVGRVHRKNQLSVESRLAFEQNPYNAYMIRQLLDIITNKATQEEMDVFREFLMRIECAHEIKKEK